MDFIGGDSNKQLTIKQLKTMRSRFSRMAIASSRGIAVLHSHVAYIKELHEKAIMENLTIEIKVTKYFVRCFGVLHEISVQEAQELPESMVIKREQTIEVMKL